MSVQTFGTNNALTAKVWAEGLDAETLAKLSYRDFMGPTSDYLIREVDDLTKQPGDRVRLGVRAQLDETDAPIQGNAGLEGNEQTIDLYYDDLTLNQRRRAVRMYDVIDPQRVSFKMREEARSALSDQWKGTLDGDFFHQLCGNTAQDTTALTGNHATTAPSEVIRPAGATTDQGLSSSTYNFTLDLIDKAVEKAKTRAFLPIRPARIDALGGELYVCFLHPYQVTSLRASGSQWTAIQRDMLRAGDSDGKKTLIFGALGVYNGTLLVESRRVTLGVNGSTDAAVSDTRRAVFAGASAIGSVTGRSGGNEERFRWVEKHFDYDNEYGIAAGLVNGMKKLVFNSVDVGCIGIHTYAAAS